MAFLDIRPVNEGHALVVPKEHYEEIFDTPSELLGKVHQVTKTVAIAVKQTVKADGISIVQQNGKAANQDIFHLHVHVIPRVRWGKDEGVPRVAIVDGKQLELTAAKIRPNIKF